MSLTFGDNKFDQSPLQWRGGATSSLPLIYVPDVNDNPEYTDIELQTALHIPTDRSTILLLDLAHPLSRRWIMVVALFKISSVRFVATLANPFEAAAHTAASFSCHLIDRWRNILTRFRNKTKRSIWGLYDQYCGKLEFSCLEKSQFIRGTNDVFCMLCPNRSTRVAV
jgi:hypothetical protein